MEVNLIGGVVSDIHGQSARAMVKALIVGLPPHEIRQLASRRLKASREELFDALQGELIDSHRFVLDELMRHIEEMDARIARFDARLLDGLVDERNVRALLQTLPGVDLIGAAMLLMEIGADMDAFGSADRLVSWVGVCPGNNESAGKRKSAALEKAIPMSGACSASSRMPPAKPSRYSSRSSSRSSCGELTNGPSSQSHTSPCAPYAS